MVFGYFKFKGCLVQVGNGTELEAVGLQFEPYLWHPCGVTWDSSQTVVVIKLQQTSALSLYLGPELRVTRLSESEAERKLLPVNLIISFTASACKPETPLC